MAKTVEGTREVRDIILERLIRHVPKYRHVAIALAHMSYRSGEFGEEEYKELLKEIYRE